MKRMILFLVLFLLLFFRFPKTIFAAAPTILTYPSTVNVDTSFTITATMSGLTHNSAYRLRIAFAQPGTSNYFGSTYNGTSWYNGTPPPISYSNFVLVPTDDTGAWSGDIQGKIELGDPNFTTGGGVYEVKIGRYTETGSSVTWSSNTVSITLIAPSPTSTPQPTPTPTREPTATTVSTATRIPLSQIMSPTHSVSKSTPTVTGKQATHAAVLAVFDTMSTPSATPPSLPVEVKSAQTHASGFETLLFFVIGGAAFIVCGILLFLKYQGEK